MTYRLTDEEVARFTGDEWDYATRSVIQCLAAEVLEHRQREKQTCETCEWWLGPDPSIAEMDDGDIEATWCDLSGVDMAADDFCSKWEAKR